MKLKKLIAKKEVINLLEVVMAALGEPFLIYSANGKLLFGDDRLELPGTYPVKVAGEMQGWVRGANQAAAVAALLAHLSERESEKKVLAQEVLDKYREINLVYRLSEKLEANLEVTAVAQLVMEEASRLIAATGGAFLLLNKPTGRLEVAATFGQGYNSHLPFVPGQGIIGAVYQTGQAEVVNNVSADPRHNLNDPHRASSLVCAPLKTREGVIGVMVMSSEVPVEYSAADLKLFNALASQAAPAIERAILYQTLEEKVRQRTEELHYRAVQLETSIAVGQSITSILSMKELLCQVANLIKERFGYDYVGIFLVNRAGTALVTQVETGPAGRLLTEAEFQLRDDQEGIIDRVIRERQSLRFDNLAQPGDDTGPVTRSELALPLLMGGIMLGVLDIQSNRPAAFQDDDLPLLQSLADQVAIAINNATLYESLARFSQELEELVRQRTQALQDAYHQLERLDRTKSDFINIASHELRTPLTLLKGYSQMLINDPAIQALASQHQQLKEVYGGVLRLHEIVETMLDVAKIDNRTLRLYREQVSMADLLQKVSKRLQPCFLERGLTLELANLADLPLIEADGDALHKVFYHLIINAVKYTPDGGRVTVTGRSLPEGPLEMIVSDTGIGIDSCFHELIFTKFYQTGELALHSTGKTKFKGAGPGLGLVIVRGIVEAHGGKVWVESPGYDEQTCPGSQFHLVLPLQAAAPEISAQSRWPVIIAA